MTPRERIALALDHKEADRVAVMDDPWFSTVERWKTEGYPEGVTPKEYFGFEMRNFSPDLSFMLPREVVEETEDVLIERNSDGTIVKNWKKMTSTPEWIGFSVNTREKWDELKHLLRMNWQRINWDDREVVKQERAQGTWVNYAASMGYDRVQGFVGSEDLLIAMAEEPDWAAEMYMATAQLIVDTAEEMMGKGFEFDGAFIFDDMGYRNAALFSPRMYKELLRPAHRLVTDFFHGKGLKVILHSCGNVKELIPLLIEDGFDCLQPLEVKAGMDVVELKKQYGDSLCFMGGIDARKMGHPDPNVIEEEIRTKIGFAKQGGGYIYSSDHSVPDSVSLQQFERVVALVKQYGAYH